MLYVIDDKTVRPVDVVHGCAKTSPNDSGYAITPEPIHVPIISCVACSLAEGPTNVQADGWIVHLDSGNKQHRIRLLGIDAPERSQDFGTNARWHLSDLVFGKQVAVRYYKIDQYGRTLGKVMLGNQDVNREVLRAGLAWHYKYYERDQRAQDRDVYIFEEARARKNPIRSMVSDLADTTMGLPPQGKPSEVNVRHKACREPGDSLDRCQHRGRLRHAHRPEVLPRELPASETEQDTDFVG
jgi:endonuclease YncB( thermonuclease family)